MRPALEGVLIGAERRRLHLACDPRIQRYAHDRLLEGKRLVRGRHRQRAEAQISRRAARHHCKAQQEPQKNLAAPAACCSALRHGTSPSRPRRAMKPRWMF